MAAPIGTHLKVLSAGAVKYVVTGLAPAFTAATGLAVDFSFGTIAGVRRQIAEGARPDVIIGTRPTIASMTQAGTVIAGSTAEIGRTLSGLGVRADTPAPDIATPERFRQALLDARSVAYTDPAAGGTSGLYLVGLLERLGIAEAVRAKTILCGNGDEVVDRVLDGSADLASTFISEIIAREGMRVAGPFPPAIEHGMDYAAGLSANGGHREAAETFIKLIADPAQGGFLRSRGFERG